MQTSTCTGPGYSCPDGWTLSGSNCTRANNTGYLSVQTAYDYRGRPVTITTPNADTQSGTVSVLISYAGFTSTITDPADPVDTHIASKTQTKDYLGRVVKITEHVENNVSQDTTYSYNAAGDLLTTTDNNANQIIFSYDTLGHKLSVNDPDRGLWTYTYDANDNLHTQQDARGTIITIEYDNLNRETLRTYSTGKSNVIYTYDNLSIPNGRGKIYSVNNGAVTKINNSYDVMGRVLSLSKVIAGDSNTYTTQFGYDLTSKLKTLTYPDNTTIGYNYYTGSGLIYNVVDMTSGKEYARYSFYEPFGKIGQINHGNGATTRYSYDVWTQRLTSIISADPTGQSANYYQYKTYKYTLAGDMKEINDQISHIAYTYTYDSLHRLKTETNNGGLAAMSLTYDALGNIVSKQVGTTTMNYTGYDPVKVHAVKTVNLNGTAYNFQYDNDGNMINGYDFTDPANVASRTMTYDEDNNLANITKGSVTAVMSYDEGGTRVKKVGASTTYYISDLYEVKNGVATKYITAGNVKLAEITNNVTYYYHSDHLGSSAVMTDAAGVVVEKTEYMPFGAVRTHTGTSVTNYKYTGQELDPESGLYFYKSRYYDNVLGRFIMPDSIYPNLNIPQELNGYTYCGNNPMMYIDPSGHSFLSDFFTDLFNTFCPWNIFQRGGLTALTLNYFDPTSSVNYTYENGFGTSGGYNYYGLDFGGGYQQFGPNRGFYCYVGYGVSYEKASAGVYLSYSSVGGGNTISVAGFVGYRAENGCNAGLQIGYSNTAGWTAGFTAGYQGANLSTSYNLTEGKWDAVSVGYSYQKDDKNINILSYNLVTGKVGCDYLALAGGLAGLAYNEFFKSALFSNLPEALMDSWVRELTHEKLDYDKIKNVYDMVDKLKSAGYGNKWNKKDNLETSIYGSM